MNEVLEEIEAIEGKTTSESSRFEGLVPARELEEELSRNEERTAQLLLHEGASMGFSEEEIRSRADTSGLNTRLEHIADRGRRALLSFKLSLAASLLLGAAAFGAEAPAPQESFHEPKTKESTPAPELKDLISTPSEVRRMALQDDDERFFFVTGDSPDRFVSAGQGEGALGRSELTPEAEHLIGDWKQATLVHIHPVGVYEIAGYTPDQIEAVREGIDPVPPSMPPSALDLLAAKRFAGAREDGEEGFCANQQVYGTDGVWSFEGGKDSQLFTEIESAIQGLSQAFSTFREGLPPNLQERFDKIVTTAENERDLRQGLICRDINELAKDPELAERLAPLEAELGKLVADYDRAFEAMEELNMLGVAMAHPEEREGAMRRYLAVVDGEGFQVTFEPHEKSEK